MVFNFFKLSFTSLFISKLTSFTVKTYILIFVLEYKNIFNFIRVNDQIFINLQKNKYYIIR